MCPGRNLRELNDVLPPPLVLRLADLSFLALILSVTQLLWEEVSKRFSDCAVRKYYSISKVFPLMNLSRDQFLLLGINNSRAFIAWEQSIKPLMIIVNRRINTSIFWPVGQYITSKEGKLCQDPPTSFPNIYCTWNGMGKKKKELSYFKQSSQSIRFWECDIFVIELWEIRLWILQLLLSHTERD